MPSLGSVVGVIDGLVSGQTPLAFRRVPLPLRPVFGRVSQRSNSNTDTAETGKRTVLVRQPRTQRPALRKQGVWPEEASRG